MGRWAGGLLDWWVPAGGRTGRRELPAHHRPAGPAARPPPPPEQPASAQSTDASDAEFGRIWRGEATAPSPTIVPGMVLGDLSTGSWTAVLVGNTVLFPRGPLSRAREAPRWWAETPWGRPDPATSDTGPRARTAAARAPGDRPKPGPGRPRNVRAFIAEGAYSRARSWFALPARWGVARGNPV
jgi:hypothetical protein